MLIPCTALDRVPGSVRGRSQPAAPEGGVGGGAEVYRTLEQG
jgi:hypothetical protein